MERCRDVAVRLVLDETLAGAFLSALGLACGRTGPEAAKVPKPGRGRPSKEQQPLARKAKRQKQRAADLFENRYLLVSHQLSKAQRQQLWRLTRGLPQLRKLREIMDEVYRLFDRRCKTQTAVQKLANAFVRTLKWMSSHSAQEIAAKMPADYAGSDKNLYVDAVKSTLPMFTNDGVMPADGPQTVLDVLGKYNPALKGKKVDLTKTYTTEFVKAAAANG